jgi:hypothetical protein
VKIAKVLKDFPCDGGFLAIDEKHEMTGRTIETYLGEKLIEPHQHPRFFYIEERPDGPWKPEPGEAYFYIGSNLGVHRSSNCGTSFQGAARASDSVMACGLAFTRSNAGWDMELIEGGNCYQTEAEALAHVPAVRRAYQGKTLQEGRYEAESDMEQARRRAGGSTLMATNAGGLH